MNVNHHHNHSAGWNHAHNHWHHGHWGGGHWGGAPGWGIGSRPGYRPGYWGGYAGRPWYRPWYSNAAVWGLGAWAIGSAYYDSGYAVYTNPYYATSTGYYDYSQPLQIVVPPQQIVQQGDGSEFVVDQAPLSTSAQSSLTHLDLARTAFSANDYALAGNELDLAIKEQPTDATLHEFRALVYFAIGDYPKAAGTLYAVLSAGPGWDWTTMSSLYPSVDIYTVQLRALEAYVKANPDIASARFVLAYQYITENYPDAAVRQLKEVVRLQPNDQLAARLIKGLGAEAASSAEPTSETILPPAAGPETVEPRQPDLPDIDPEKILGHLTAERTDGTKFTLDLTAEKTFNWSFEQAGKKNEFGGTYTIDGAVLVLERADKATMPGTVTMKDDGFNFKLFGAPDDDPGLDFRR